ncbi:hypothetical protein AB0C12_39615 [Actinoplanes sp. NPDC048967]|uniref:hypothetical protein n=1 Tax=Actinoplanes sp. NPDC048967 TaxID=3155269 RepID=UPI0033CA0542
MPAIIVDILTWFGVGADASSVWTGGAISVGITLGVLAVGFLWLVFKYHASARKAAALAGAAVITTVAFGTLIGMHVPRPTVNFAEPAVRPDCQGVGKLPSDPGFRPHLSCAPSSLVNTSFDLDRTNHWNRSGYPSDPPWRAGVDVFADATTLRAGHAVRMVLSNDNVASYVDCADQDAASPLQAVQLADLRANKVHAICLVTDQHRRALLKIDGEGGPGEPISVHAVVWNQRLGGK